MGFIMTMDHRRGLKSVFGRLAGSAGAFARNFRTKLLVVAFHRVNDRLPPDGLTCTVDQFTAFCAFFAKYFRVVALSEQVQGCVEGREMGGTLSITFDDGYADNFEIAAPILREHGLPATFFVTTGFLGTQYMAPWDVALPVHPGWMTWEQVRLLVAQGFDIGSHTDMHLDLGSSSAETVRADLALSKSKIQDATGIDTRFFAYPFGRREHISERSLEIVRELGFDCCLGCYGGTNPPLADPYHLNRIGIAEWFATPDQFGFELMLGKV